MPMSTDMKRAQSAANAYDDTLRADDPRFSRSVQIRHEDGSVQFLDSTFVLQWADPEVRPGGSAVWLFVFPEHHAVQVHAIDELLDWTEFERVGETGWLEKSMRLEDVEMSPEDEARAEAAIAQADLDHPPTHEPITVDGVTTVRRISKENP